MSASVEERLQALEARVRHFEDREQILRTLYDYVHMMEDGRDADAYADLFTEDAVWDGRPVTSTGGGGGFRVEGRKAIRAWFNEPGKDDPKYWEEPRPAANHNIVVVDIRIDGDRANVTSNMLITREHPNGPIIFGMGHWYDVLVRCEDGRWRFNLRRLRRQGTVPTFQRRNMTTPVGEERERMAESWRKELEEARRSVPASPVARAD